MDLNWCQYCEKHLQEDIPSEYSTDDEDGVLPAPPAKVPKTGKKTKGLLVRRNHSAAKLQTKSRPVPEPPKPAQFEPWTGTYCSQECMQKDEQRSRLAIANLKPVSSSGAIPRRPSSSASSSGYSQNDDYGSPMESYNASRSFAYAQRPIRTSRSGLSLDLRRVSYPNKSSSDSLASPGSPGQPFFPIPSMPRGTSRSSLRPMTPIRSTFIEEEHAPKQQHGTKADNPISATLKPALPDAMRSIAQSQRKSSSSIATTKAGLLPSKSLAIPYLSQGSEGNATGVVFSPNSLGMDDFMARPSRHRSQASNSSLAYYSGSPGSSAESVLSSRSGGSTSSTAPSEAPGKGDYFSHRRADSTGEPAYAPATLQDYALYAPRSVRTPPVHSLAGTTPPRAVQRMSASYDTGGTISTIIHAKVQERFAKPERRQSVDRKHRELVPFPSHQAEERGLSTSGRRQSYSSIRRTGSTASVTSLPHHFSELALNPKVPRNRSSMSIRAAPPISPGPKTSTSAPKAWNWEGMPQYKLMNDGQHPSDRKRLFYFDGATTTPRLQ